MQDSPVEEEVSDRLPQKEAVGYEVRYEAEQGLQGVAEEPLCEGLKKEPGHRNDQ